MYNATDLALQVMLMQCITFQKFGVMLALHFNFIKYLHSICILFMHIQFRIVMN